MLLAVADLHVVQLLPAELRARTDGLAAPSLLCPGPGPLCVSGNGCLPATCLCAGSKMQPLPGPVYVSASPLLIAACRMTDLRKPLCCSRAHASASFCSAWCPWWLSGGSSHTAASPTSRAGWASCRSRWASKSIAASCLAMFGRSTIWLIIVHRGPAQSRRSSAELSRAVHPSRGAASCCMQPCLPGVAWLTMTSAQLRRLSSGPGACCHLRAVCMQLLIWWPHRLPGAHTVAPSAGLLHAGGLSAIPAMCKALCTNSCPPYITLAESGQADRQSLQYAWVLQAMLMPVTV